jgi:hypothetical protein
MRTGLIAACGLLGSLGCRSTLDQELVAALVREPAVTLEVDARGAITTWAVPVDPGRIPARAMQAALAVQPGGTPECWHERGAHGEGFRVLTVYPSGLRTVLVSEAGDVLHKSWEIPAGEAPEPVRAAAAETAPGDPERIEVLQGPGRDVLYRVTSLGPDRRRRAWTGDALGNGTTHVLARIETWAAGQ